VGEKGGNARATTSRGPPLRARGWRATT